nr:MAG TPA: hypothetical protein [Caudoviricetes sp.]
MHFLESPRPRRGQSILLSETDTSLRIRQSLSSKIFSTLNDL